MEKTDKKKMKQLNEVVDINRNKVFVENGKIKSILHLHNQPTDYVDVETAFEIINNEIDRIYQDGV